MKFKTYDEWKALGYHVRLGEKRVGRDAQTGKAVFSEAQVELTKKPAARYGYDQYAGWDYEGSMEEALGGWDWYK